MLELRGQKSILSLFVLKWQAIMEMLRTDADSRSVKRAQEVRRIACESGDWETARELDRIQALCTLDGDLCAHVFFGTPFEEYRALLLRDWKGSALPQTYLWRFGPSKPDFVLDLLFPRVSERKRPSARQRHRWNTSSRYVGPL